MDIGPASLKLFRVALFASFAVSAIFCFWIISPASAHAATFVTGDLAADATWTLANSPYVVQARFTVLAGVTLTIEPGVIVKSDTPQFFYAFNVLGTLIARGTPTQKIYFTAYKDDALGGDTNGDGADSAPQPGGWNGISFVPGALGEFEHAVIRYSGGNTGFNGCGCALTNFGGNIRIAHSLVESNSGNGVRQLSGTTLVASSTFSENGTSFWLQGGTTTITGTEISRSTNGIFAEFGALILTGNTFSENQNHAVEIRGGVEFTHAHNTASGNFRGGFMMLGNIAGNQVWHSDSMPYIIGGTFGIPEDTSLTITKGTVVKFNSFGFFNSLAINGTLNVEGEENEPVYFTSIKDDSIGGDTNGDGTDSAPAVGDWGVIWFTYTGIGNVSHAVFRYLGGGSGFNGCACAFVVYGGNVYFLNSVIELSNIAFRQLDGTLTILNSKLLNNTNGLWLEGGTSTISNSRIEKSVGNGIAATRGALLLASTTFINNGQSAVDIKAEVDFVHSGTTVSGNLYNGFTMTGALTRNQTWAADSIPYIIYARLYIPPDLSLTIEKGAVVKFVRGNAFDSFGGQGALNVEGTKENPVYFTSLKDDSVGGDANNDGGATLPSHQDWSGLSLYGTSNINHAVIRFAGAGTAFNGCFCAVVTGGRASFANSEIATSSANGFRVTDGVLNVVNSKIHGHELGVWHEYGTTTISGSAIADNTRGILNTNPNPAVAKVDAKNNWWGDASGPLHPVLNPTGLGNQVIGNVDFIPWLGADPTETPPLEECCSNVAFLPGLQGSRLYRPGEDQVWEPQRNQDAEELYLSSATGESINTDIYTRDVIDESPQIISGYNIYKNFIEFMDEEVVDTGIINEWKALPYDWRMDLDTVLASGKKIGEKNGESNISYLEATSTPYIFQELKRLAENSKTEKVSIITHSNGGLLAKFLLSEIENQGHPYHFLLGKIDKLIMVAAPQVGTPMAIEGMLHGDEQQLGAAVGTTDWGLILDEKRARELAENMQSGYNLLPSRRYFDLVESPVVEFKSSADRVHEFSDLYGDTINSGEELNNFLLGDPQAGEQRNEPVANDEESPNVLKTNFLEKSTDTHNAIDNWMPPEGLEVIQIAGWGIKTVRGIEYSCGVFSCRSLSTLDRDLLKTHEGDGTVVLPSAVAMDTAQNVERYYVNIRPYNSTAGAFLGINFSHGDILTIDTLNSFLKNLLQNDRTLTENITTTVPPIEDLASLDYTIHSPVDIHLYDAEGNHTGLISNPLPNSDLKAYEAKLPNSYYWEYGEVKYAGSDTSTTTIIQLIGTDLGTFTFNISQTLGDEIVATTTFQDVPITASSTLTMEIQTIANSGPLKMDVDGDGITDTNIAPGEGVTPQELIAILKGILKTFNLSQQKEKSILEKIDNLEKVLAKEYKDEFKEKRRTNKALNEIADAIRKLEKKNILSREESRELTGILGKIQNSVIE